MFNTLFSQDFHFSQYNENPLLMNPALAGSTNVMRVSINYRNQWQSVTTPYSSYGLSFESRFKANNWEKVDPKQTMTFKKSSNRMAGGLSIYNDKAGDSKLGTLAADLTYAMFFPLNKTNSLSLGIQGGFVQRKMDPSKLIYGAQYNGYIYDPTMPTGEVYSRQSFIYGDVGGGICYTLNKEESAVGANDRIIAQIGLGAFHLTRPNQNFTSGEKDRLYRKYVFHGSLLFGIPNSKIGIAPSWICQVQGSSKEIMAGMILKYYIKDNSKYTGILKQSSIGIGSYYRTGDAVVPTLLIETGRFALGFSYDINTSKLASASSAKGGFEITLRMMTPSAFLYQRHASKSMF